MVYRESLFNLQTIYAATKTRWQGIELPNSDHSEFEPLPTFKNFYLATIREQVQFYLPDDNMMNTLAALDQRKWPLPISELRQDQNIRIAFQRWPSYFGLPTNTAMNDLDQLVDYLENNCFWNIRLLASPTEFWTQLRTGN